MSDLFEAQQTTLKGAIALAHDIKTHPQAKEQFEALRAQLANENADMAELLQQLWQEYIALQRSATFWQSMSEAEKGLAEKVTESNIQLKQNYLRLVQEQ
jgi:uncharacterized membrane-anchored protein YhcB (DUF1043 family)